MYSVKKVDYKNKFYKKGCVKFGFPILEGYRKAACECSNNMLYEDIYKDNYSKSCTTKKLRYNQTIKTVQNKNGNIDIKYNNSYKKYLYRRVKSYETMSRMEKKFNRIKVLRPPDISINKMEKCYNYGDAKIVDCSRSNSILYKPSNAGFSTQGAVSNGEKMNRLKYNTILHSQLMTNDSSNNNLVNGAYPVSLYKNTHPINKKNEPDPCTKKSCYGRISCIRYCK
jgi:hypothetical protein